MRPGHVAGDNKERDAQIYARRQNGETLIAIGVAYNLTKERVRQICVTVERRARREVYREDGQ